MLNQTRSNFEVVVMDNAGSPATKEVVDAFESPHIRYFRTPNRLAMTDNWELALEHVSGDYVTFLGDDDGALPDTIEIAEEIHKFWPNTILTWKPLVYFWPNFFVEAYQNLVHMHVGSLIEQRSSSALLGDVYAGKKTYEELPSLYFSFVPRLLIESVRAKYGRYFLSRSPDIASGLINAAASDMHIYSYRPLGIRGVSHHSTGAFNSFPHPHIESNPAQLFNEEVKGGTWDEYLHKDLAGEFMVEVAIVSELLYFKEKYLSEDNSIQPNMKAFLKWFCESAARYMTRYDDAKEAIHQMAKKAGVPLSDLEIAPCWKSIARATFNPKLDKDTNTLSFSYYANQYLVRDVAEFAMAAGRLTITKEMLMIQNNAVVVPPKRTIVQQLFRAMKKREPSIVKSAAIPLATRRIQ